MKSAAFLLSDLMPNVLRIGLFLVFGIGPCLAAATLSQQIDPPEVTVGDEVTVTLTIQGGGASNIELPPVDGLQVVGNNSSTNVTFTNGAFSSSISQSFILVPSRAGNFTIPAFDIHTQDGQVLHVQPMKLHVLSGGNNVSSNPSPARNSVNPAANSNGPVVIPPNAPPAPDNSENSADATGSSLDVPRDSDGRPAKVFLVITPKTTDAYVGESIPMRIEFFLRRDVAYQQDSLPTIKGSDFLMNNLATRFREDLVSLAGEDYIRQSWVTAISAPKNGDFPLQMERDSYWVKSSQNRFADPFNNFFFSRPSLAHENIGSNQLTIHVHSLPDEGRPANFTGAIGQLKVTGTAAPDSVAVGEPVTLHFTVSGEGNFDYVKSPTLAPDPAWKSYVPSSKIEYEDESRTQGVKTFEQAVIPQKNGTLPLPAASFSYFDPTTKQYVTTPVTLPAITVTGSSLPISPLSNSSTPAAEPATIVTPKTSDFVPNRVDMGSLQTSLTPVYRQPWFWVAQSGLFLLLVVSALGIFLRSRPDDTAAERTLRQHTLHREEDAMSDAVRRGDARAFFLSARHAVQLKLGSQWRMSPEAITLAEIRHRNPQLAETLEPLFNQADEVIYSGEASGNLDLAPWEIQVRRQLLQLQSS